MIYKVVIRFIEHNGQGFTDAWMVVRQLPDSMRRWWHEHLQRDMQAGDGRVKQSSVYLRKREG